MEIPTPLVVLGPTECGGLTPAQLIVPGNGYIRMREWGKGHNSTVINSGPWAYFRPLCCTFPMQHGIFNIHGTPCGPQDVYPGNHKFCSLSSNFDLTLLVSIPKSAPMSPSPCHCESASASDAMIHSEQSGSSDNLFPHLSHYF